jgi:uncharacterized protein (TIGR02145 family)/uncharacterized repeat protein (TIGR02543 family)
MRTFTLILAMMLSGMLLQAQTGEPCPGEPTVTYDGQTYNTILVGDRCWLKENLNVGTMILSEQNQSDNGLIEKYCYGDLPANCETYGGFYQWREAMQYDFTPGAQGICPPTGGWRIPTDDEWKMLEGAADSQYDYGDPEWDNMNFRGSDAGKNLKAQNGWLYNGNGFDILGAAVLPGGHRDLCSAYYSEGHSNYLWTATQQDDNTAWYRILASSTAKVSRRYAHNNMAASVRCVKDYEPAPTTYNLNLEVSPADAGTVTGTGQYEAGEEINITAEANTGWEFVNWTDDDGIVSEAANFVYTMPAEEVTLTANFTEEQVGFTCGDPLVDSRDGNEYTTVQIGDQCWMAENLAYLPAVSPSSQGNNTDPYYYVHGYQGTDVNAAKATDNYNNYGALYNWPASLNACPEGWHLPTDAEWTFLTTYLGGQSVAGGKMKSTRTAPDPHPRWQSPNTGATNSSGFTGLPGGYRDSDGDFYYIGNYGTFWSSTEYSTTYAWYRTLFYDYAYVNRTYTTKAHGFGVRCLRD